ncbi:MAG TPA: DNA repair protein RadC, partial [Myxococcales bacterium]|nr:DNA repair protein RadC [Myxococcales bacterium]
PVAEVEVARGGLSACPVSPSDVFRSLIKEAAAGVVFVHNHPSGEPSP